MEADRSLSSDGLAVWDGFLPQAQVKVLNACAGARLERGEFGAARIGAGRDLQRRADLRGDSICWLEEPLFPAERELLAQLERIRLDLNKSLFLGLYETEMHYACYPRGARYARHVDHPRDCESRKLSLILYLNEAWRPEDGGSLRCRTDAGEFRDIQPIAGRLVMFLTPGREHEVLPTLRERWSLSGWFLGRSERPLR